MHLSWETTTAPIDTCIMKLLPPTLSSKKYRTVSRYAPSLLIALLLAAPSSARASIFQGEALDTAANVLSWVVLIVVPIVAIVAFWLVHILPEKIAEKRHHPQTAAIQTLCLLSLVFGGLLWPLAWLWAYSKPVLYKMAYGTDEVVHGEETPKPVTAKDDAEELKQLRKRISELESKQVAKPTNEGKV
jgi:CBS domain containing-hemolysin-like protein